MYELYFHLTVFDRIIHIHHVPNLHLNTYRKECFASELSLKGMLNRKTTVWQTGKNHIAEFIESIFSYTYILIFQNNDGLSKNFVKSSEQEIILREMFVWSAVSGCDSHRVLLRQHPSSECH